MRVTTIATFLLPFTLFAAACAVDTNEDPANPANPDDGAEETGVQTEELGAKPTFATVGPTVAATCGGCHAKFNTLAGIKGDKTNMIAMISAGAMPKGNPGWKKTADGKKVVKWLKTGADLK